MRYAGRPFHTKPAAATRATGAKQDAAARTRIKNLAAEVEALKADAEAVLKGQIADLKAEVKKAQAALIPTGSASKASSR